MSYFVLLARYINGIDMPNLRITVSLPSTQRDIQADYTTGFVLYGFTNDFKTDERKIGSEIFVNLFRYL